VVQRAASETPIRIVAAGTTRDAYLPLLRLADSADVVQSSPPKRARRRAATVKHHLANARSKAGAATTAQLVWILAPRLPEPSHPAQSDE
jgi:hypothetical protein